MNISVGIVGLPNVGKSTLFNALTNAQVDAQNYPFCTIEPNKGIVAVSDERLDKLAEIEKSKNMVSAVIEFVDIAGLVKGASQGAGLGNQFLSHIREVAAIAHIVRDFENSNVIHVDGNVDPIRDVSTIETELMIKDIDTVEKKLPELEKRLKLDKSVEDRVNMLKNILTALGDGKLAYSVESKDDPEIAKFRKELFLLTDKPFIYILNSKDAKPNIDPSKLKIDANFVLPLDIKLEYELSELDANERGEYLEGLGMDSTGLEKLTRVCYDILGLISFFTAGEQEARAWTIRKGQTIQQAAGAIHTDFEKNFIAADVASYKDFVGFGGWQGAKEAGKVRLEGKTYIVQDGDVVIIRHN